MSQKNRMHSLVHGVRETPAARPATAPEPDAEPVQLARELDRAFADELERFRQAREQTAQRPNPNKPLPAEFVEGLLQKTPEDVSFFDLDRLAKVDSARACARWREVQQTAGRDLTNGWHAGRALEQQGGSAWERACFGALRRLLRRAWPPRDEVETLLIDELAQYELLRRHWIGVLASRSRDARTLGSLGRRTQNDDSERLTSAAATQEALRTVERLQRLVHHTLRLLLNLRRVKAPVIVRRAGQVNVSAGPQLNLQAVPASVQAPSQLEANDV